MEKRPLTTIITNWYRERAAQYQLRITIMMSIIKILLSLLKGKSSGAGKLHKL